MTSNMQQTDSAKQTCKSWLAQSKPKSFQTEGKKYIFDQLTKTMTKLNMKNNFSLM